MRELIYALSTFGLIVAGSIGSANGAELSPGSEALVEANVVMHEAMAIEMTGDVDVDFMRAMIPHHEGAVAMAKIVIESGKDPEVRKLAEEVVKAQEAEIAFMKAWLEQNGAGEGEVGGSGATDHSAH